MNKGPICVVAGLLALLATEFFVLFAKTLIVFGHLLFGRGGHKINRSADNRARHADCRTCNVSHQTTGEKRGSPENSRKNNGFTHGSLRPQKTGPIRYSAGYSRLGRN